MRFRHFSAIVITSYECSTVAAPSSDGLLYKYIGTVSRDQTHVTGSSGLAANFYIDRYMYT